ncbi:phosphotransferase family protein [Hyphomonas sp. CY54-11-8]|uniref:phosphotransferase family protein n=1 Tax=Hyphomonas sp. CY54-11-8 TaxID=1280944 RepID=UPI000458BE6E|nr:phosphotransferase family protein [Hyphomonas sp. CY54-11-8]KCZ45761.1 hypothetical protein HY17_10515 [Hyphomonas sp. CY54-11-8]
MTIDMETARHRLTGWFGARIPGAQKLEVSALTAPGAGASNETYFVSVAYQQGCELISRELVIRWPPSGFHVFPPESYDMQQQYELLKRLQQTSVPSPAVFGVETDQAVLGMPFYVMERVSGWIPGDFPPYHSAGRLFESSEAEREKVWWSGLKTVAQVHAVDAAGTGLDMLGVPEQTGFMEGQIRLYDAVLAQNHDPVPDTLVAARRWLIENAFTPPCQCLCWGDARIGNMIFDDDLSVVAALDWEMAAIGDPIADLAWFIHVDWAASEGRPRSPTPRLKGFPDREATIAKYEALTGRTVENFNYYDVLAAYRLAVVYTRIEQDQNYLDRSGNTKGMLTITHFEKLDSLIGL